MSPQNQVNFRTVLLEYVKEIPERDARTQIDAVEKLERWIDNYASEAVNKALIPYIKITTSEADK